MFHSGKCLKYGILRTNWSRENDMAKKIAFHLNCLEQGGAERVVSNLSNRFVQNLSLIHI